MKSTRLIRLEEVKRRTGYQKTSIYNGIAGGTFPRPVPLGARAVAWVEDEIQEWIDSRISERDNRRCSLRPPWVAVVKLERLA
jgi:prophage regulatory protein